jgi:hypothetical protein
VTNEELTELERLCKQATPGPWRYDDGRTDGDERGKPAWVDTITAAGHTLIAEPSDHPGLDAMDANARLIVAAVNALPRLVARVRELEAERARLRPEVRRFAELMEEKLRANDHKGGWQGDSAFDLVARASEELDELDVAVSQHLARRAELPAVRSHWLPNAMRVAREAADVANFAMMVADVCGALAPAEGKEGGR